MFTVKDREYYIKYNIRTLEKIENILDNSMMSKLASNSGMLSIPDLKIIIGNAIFNDEGHKISPQQGMDMVMGLIEENGYLAINKLVADTLQKDLPFLFQEI